MIQKKYVFLMFMVSASAFADTDAVLKSEFVQIQSEDSVASGQASLQEMSKVYQARIAAFEAVMTSASLKPEQKNKLMNGYFNYAKVEIDSQTEKQPELRSLLNGTLSAVQWAVQYGWVQQSIQKVKATSSWLIQNLQQKQ